MSKRISMRKIKEILRLKWQLSRSNREIAASIQISSSTVSECLKRAKQAGLGWLEAAELDDEYLEQKLYVPVRNHVPEGEGEIDWIYIHQELRRRGVTRYLLWDEYKQQHPCGISYSRFCDRYREWRKSVDVCMRQEYKAGEKMIVDYAGMTMPITNRETGEVTEAEIFVAALGASNKTYAEATQSQSLPDWISSHVRAFNFYGGVPEIIVPDNLKSGVHKSHRYEPDLNPTYADMAAHYAVAVIPARVRAPQDKAKAEEAVQNVERQILAKLRDRTFFSLHELNQAIKPLLGELNDRPFQKLPGSRNSQFETLEKPVLRALPESAYVFAEWKKAIAASDYHIALNGHYYSVPYTLIKKKLDVRYTKDLVEMFYNGKRVAAHRYSACQGKATTVTEHMPKAHREYSKWTQETILDWAKQNGKFTATLTEKIFLSKQHPLQSLRSCVGITRLGLSYGKERLEAACKRAIAIGVFSYKSLQSILQNNLDQIQISKKEEHHVTESHHENIRGQDYFQ